MWLQDFRQLPAAKKPRDASEIVGQGVGGPGHEESPRLGLRGISNERPPRRPDRDIGSSMFMEGAAQPLRRALVALAGRGLG